MMERASERKQAKHIQDLDQGGVHSLFLLLHSSMEALWKLEDKYKVSTQGALLVFVCSAFLAIGLCTTSTAVLRKKATRKQLVHNDQAQPSGAIPNAPTCCHIPIKKVLVGSVRWSRAHRWDGREQTPPLLGLEQFGVEAGWHSHNSSSPVWQRPILMGEKCELPRFSGLILYDENGHLLPYNHKHESYQTTNQESTTAVRTTLKDLL